MMATCSRQNYDFIHIKCLVNYVFYEWLILVTALVRCCALFLALVQLYDSFYTYGSAVVS